VTTPVKRVTTPDAWPSQLRDVVRSGRELLGLLGIDPREAGMSDAAAAEFPLKVPMAYVRRMRPGDPRDPLLLQVLAGASELLNAPGYGRDPVGETGPANPLPGIIQKYRGRALLIATGGCAIHCRYCFRRHFPYDDNRNSRFEWRQAAQHLANDPTISEVILSGGDPLVAGDEQLGELVDLLAAIPQVRRLRIHTRLPVVIPDRVTGSLLDAVCRDRLQTVVVIHSNHPNEIDASVEGAMARLGERGVTLLNQSVLLAQVNDSAATLSELSERLFGARVLPYYLHLLDPVRGAAHFEVPEERARALAGELANRLPGYLVPRLVRETAGAGSKIFVAPRYTE
jgi:EF-P beta-lysylation protein EpmB